MPRITLEPAHLLRADGTRIRLPLPHKKARKVIRSGNTKDDRPTSVLYHYTSHEAAEKILREGIRKGDVPTSREAGCNGVWLTTVDRLGASHGWDSTGRLDKTSIRFVVELPDRDNRLWHWPRLARRAQIDRDYYDSLDQSGNGESDHWYVYFGTIPVASITEMQAAMEEAS
jgi:hypothetical protein